MIRLVSALWKTLFRQKRIDQELDDEICTYLELLAGEKRRSGMPADEAMREARRELGRPDHIKEDVRDIRIGASMDTLIQDLRYAIRTLWKNPSFTAVAVMTLALGIGANTTIFTVVNGVLLKPLPYPEPDRVLNVAEKHLLTGDIGTVSASNFYDWREQSHSFSAMAAMDSYPDFIFNGSGEPQRLTGAAISSSFFSIFGVRMALGRDFLEEEDRPGHNQVVILSYAAWTRYFDARPDIAGKTLTLNDRSYTVVGVLPRDFSLVRSPSEFQARQRFDVWTPLGFPSPPEPWRRGTHGLSVFARLKPGVTMTQAQTDLDRISAIIQRLYPNNKHLGVAATSLSQHVVANVKAALFTLMAAVGMVFLIACANIANLLLTRAATRQKEMTLRVALGATRRRLARQLLTESMVLALTGGVLGAAIALLGVPTLVRHLPADLPRASEIVVDGRVLTFTSLIALVTGIVFGLVPLFQTWRASASEALKQSGRSVTGGRSWLRSALVVGQVAIAMVLLTGAGLMIKSFWTLLQVSPGFQSEHVLTARLSLPPQYTNGYPFGTGKHREISAFQRQLLERVRDIPGVTSVAFAAYLPLRGTNNSWSFEIEGRPPNQPGVHNVTNYRPVSAEYFETIGIPIERGRTFTPADNEDGPLVIAINQTMAHTFWSGQNPIGQRLRFSESKWRTIVGIVGDVRHEGLGTKPEPEMYLPYSQAPNTEARPTIVLRTSTEPSSVIDALRRAVAEVGPTVPVDQIETMKQIVSGSVGQSRFRTAVIFVFALLALLVASTGLYGVMSYLVSQRIREFGIRMAVGASRAAVLRLVLRHAAKLVSIGIAVGLAAAAVLARLIATLLYGVKPFEASTLATVAILLATVALIASYVPAQRAAKADPMDSLRHE